MLLHVLKHFQTKRERKAKGKQMENGKEREGKAGEGRRGEWWEEERRGEINEARQERRKEKRKNREESKVRAGVLLVRTQPHGSFTLRFTGSVASGSVSPGSPQNYL